MEKQRFRYLCSEVFSGFTSPELARTALGDSVFLSQFNEFELLYVEGVLHGLAGNDGRYRDLLMVAASCGDESVESLSRGWLGMVDLPAWAKSDEYIQACDEAFEAIVRISEILMRSDSEDFGGQAALAIASLLPVTMFSAKAVGGRLERTPGLNRILEWILTIEDTNGRIDRLAQICGHDPTIPEHIRNLAVSRLKISEGDNER